MGKVEVEHESPATPGLCLTEADPLRYLVWCAFPWFLPNFVLNFIDVNEFLVTEKAADILR